MFPNLAQPLSSQPFEAFKEFPVGVYNNVPVKILILGVVRVLKPSKPG